MTKRISKFQPLGDYVQTRAEEEFVLTFAEIEEVVGFALSPTAQVHRAYWSGHETGVQRLWDGWHAHLERENRCIRFVRAEETE